MIWQSFRKYCLAPALMLVTLVVIRPWLVLMGLSDTHLMFSRYIFSLIVILLVSWLAIRSVDVLRDYVTAQYDIEAKDNLRARRIHTQLNILRQIVSSP